MRAKKETKVERVRQNLTEVWENMQRMQESLNEKLEKNVGQVETLREKRQREFELRHEKESLRQQDQRRSLERQKHQMVSS